MLFPFVVACAGCAAAVILDIRYRRIPNLLTLPLIVAGPLAALFAGGWPGFAHSIELLAVLLAGGLMLHRTGWLGGGDIKLALGIAVLLGYPKAVTFLLCTGIAGGVLALAIALARRRGTLLTGQMWSVLIASAAGNARVAPIAAAPVDERIPYACAIAAGLAIALLLPILDHARFGS